MFLQKFVVKPVNFTTKVSDFIAPLVDLALRFWIFKVFFMSGLTKIKTWQSTVTLFKYEYKVPLLSPEVAAYCGTAAELILPCFLLAGLGARLPALLLFIFNIVAVYSYQSFLFSTSGAAGLMQHILWGFILAAIVAHGHGKISIDYLLGKISGDYQY